MLCYGLFSNVYDSKIGSKNNSTKYIQYQNCFANAIAVQINNLPRCTPILSYNYIWILCPFVHSSVSHIFMSRFLGWVGWVRWAGGGWGFGLWWGVPNSANRCAGRASARSADFASFKKEKKKPRRTGHQQKLCGLELLQGYKPSNNKHFIKSKGKRNTQIYRYTQW